MAKTETTDVRQCGECGTEWEAPMGSPFVCPRCGFTSTLLGTHPLPSRTNDEAISGIMDHLYRYFGIENPKGESNG